MCLGPPDGSGGTTGKSARAGNRLLLGGCDGTPGFLGFKGLSPDSRRFECTAGSCAEAACTKADLRARKRLHRSGLRLVKRTGVARMSDAAVRRS